VSMFLIKAAELERIMYISFIAGNVVYFCVGILFAYHFRDNRAFCKYFCPITVFLKPMSYFSILRVKKTESECVRCNKCISVCPMDVNMLDNNRKRKNATECILCGECIRACPKKALKM
jgi:polyferredoxin